MNNWTKWLSKILNTITFSFIIFGKYENNHFINIYAIIIKRDDVILKHYFSEA